MPIRARSEAAAGLHAQLDTSDVLLDEIEHVTPNHRMRARSSHARGGSHVLPPESRSGTGHGYGVTPSRRLGATVGGRSESLSMVAERVDDECGGIGIAGDEVAEAPALLGGVELLDDLRRRADEDEWSCLQD
jgi:hypothetical protein